MALQVWLPLTKDLRNQGLSDVTVTNNGATFNSAGKLGGCYYFNRSTPNYLKITNPLTTATNGVSMAFWVKLPSNGSVNDQLVHIGNGSGWTNNRFTCFVRSGASTLVFSCGDGTSNTNYNCMSSALTLDQWTHVICLYSNGKMRIYLNGVLDKEYSTTIVPSFTNVAYIGIGAGPNVTEPATAYLNDVRIYDHALSEMEVKRLSQGLVLHYPLNRGGFGQENLITQAMINAEPWASAIQGNYTIDGKIGWILTNYQLYSKSGNGANNIFSGLTYDTNTQYTISFKWRDDYRTDGKSSSLYIRFKYSDGTYSQVISSKDYNYWKEEIMTSTAGKTVSAITTTYGNGGNLLFTDLKLEKGAIKTPFSPIVNSDLYNSMSLNGTTEYDCSGFCNNGTRTGTFSWTSDTPKYSVSTYLPNTTTTTTFDDKCWITVPFILNNINQLTVSFWFKKEAITRGGLFTTNVATYTGTDLTVDDYDNSVKIRASDGTSVTLGSYDNLIPANTWCHWVVTFDGINVKVYVNSILKNTVSYSATKMLKNITNITLGANKAGGVYRTAKGSYSDFRIYATALSASDVKSLYQNCATIDADGTIHGQIRS